VPIVPSTAALHLAQPVALRLDQPAPSTTTFVRDVRGGAIAGNVVASASGAEHFTRKQLDRVLYEDISIQVGTSMPAALFNWIATSWSAKSEARDGAVLWADSSFTVRIERPFRGALISETSFPAFDAASKDPGWLTVRIVPLSVEPDSNPGSKLQSTIGKGITKLWLVSNFRLEIAGLDCTRVSRIEPFSVRRPIEMARPGRGRPILSAGRIDFPNLRVTLAAISAPTWQAWHKSFVVDGKNTDADQRAGSISLLAPNHAELARIELGGLGIVRLSTDPPEPHPANGASLVKQVTADLYCEQMTLKPGGAP
jgi:hypothetical protein